MNWFELEHLIFKVSAVLSKQCVFCKELCVEIMHSLPPGVRKFVQKFRKTDMLLDYPRSPCNRTVRTNENMTDAAESVRRNPRTSTRYRSQQINISRTSLRRILYKDLGLFASKFQVTKKLKIQYNALLYRFSVCTYNSSKWHLANGHDEKAGTDSSLWLNIGWHFGITVALFRHFEVFNGLWFARIHIFLDVAPKKEV